MGTFAAVRPNSVLTAWNSLPPDAAAAAVLPCCGSQAWAAALASERPFADMATLLSAAKRVWDALTPSDWQQAFDSHPRIGEQKPQGTATEASLAWSRSEQSAAMAAEHAQKDALRQANALYEQRFGRIFIICARGRSAPEILQELQRRLTNAPDQELLEAAREQSRITALRLTQWLQDT